MGGFDDLRRKIDEKHAEEQKAREQKWKEETTRDQRKRRIEMRETEVRNRLSFFFTQLSRETKARVQTTATIFSLITAGYQAKAERVFTDELMNDLSAGPWHPYICWRLSLSPAESSGTTRLLWWLVGPGIEDGGLYETYAPPVGFEGSFREAVRLLGNASPTSLGAASMNLISESNSAEYVDRWVKWLVGMA